MQPNSGWTNQPPNINQANHQGEVMRTNANFPQGYQYRAPQQYPMMPGYPLYACVPPPPVHVIQQLPRTTSAPPATDTRTSLEKKRLRNRINQAKLRVREKQQNLKDKEDLITLRAQIAELDVKLEESRKRLLKFESETPDPPWKKDKTAEPPLAQTTRSHDNDLSSVSSVVSDTTSL